MALATVVPEWTCDLTWPKQRSLGFSLNIYKSVSPPTVDKETCSSRRCCQPSSYLKGSLKMKSSPELRNDTAK